MTKPKNENEPKIGTQDKILEQVQKTNAHISEIYTRIDKVKDNQISMQQSMFDLSQEISKNQLNDFNTKEEITKKVDEKIDKEVQKQIQTIAKKHGGNSGKKWGAVGTIAAAIITFSFKIYEKLSN